MSACIHICMRMDVCACVCASMCVLDVRSGRLMQLGLFSQSIKKLMLTS